jgi:bifunctional non-homologous end joining protein LigD
MAKSTDGVCGTRRGSVAGVPTEMPTHARWTNSTVEAQPRMADVVRVGEHDVAVTNLDKILWPRLGLTKAWLLAYYSELAPVIVPHLTGHPVTLHRFPDGVDGNHWYQTRAPAHPEWVEVVTMRPQRTGKVFDVIVIRDSASLLWAANAGTIEFHPYLGRAARLDEPVCVVFDLDPGPGVAIGTVCDLAVRLRDILDTLGLRSYPKTSGGHGVHIYVPLNRPHSYPATKAFARKVAETLRADDPERVVTRMNRAERSGRIFVDWSQNDAGKSTVSAYSLRGYEVPTVSAPVTWQELRDIARTGLPNALPITAFDIERRILERGDLFKPVLSDHQALPRA